jgi:mannobiose 2-epimerase
VSRPRRPARGERPAIAARVALGALLLGCRGGAPAPSVAPATSPGPALVDSAATPETRALFVNLRRLAHDHVLFGHQDDLAYGVEWYEEHGRSDVKETAGAYPAVYGWDATPLFRAGPADTAVGTRTRHLRQWIAEGYGRGGVITLSWHPGNPVTGGNAWDTTAAVAQLLPGGSHHQAYRARLDTLGSFLLSLRARGRSGEDALVPVIFRPFHEMSGNWFWWGARHVAREDYIRLWRFTVTYLRDRRRVHNLLWAFSTDVFDSPAAYLDRYPGDGYVDVLGFDDYQSVKTPATRVVFARRLRDVVELAEARGKIPALTETGVEAIPDSLWWTQTLLAGIRADSVGRRIAWVLVWRNATFAREHRRHFYAPYPGHPSVPDFVRFRATPGLLFEDGLPDLYRSEPRAPVRARVLPATERALLAAEIRASLRHDVLAPWYPHAIDREAGGFLSQFDDRWQPTGDQDKMIVTQARHVWTTARAAQFFPLDTVFRPAAAHGFHFLRDRLWDQEDGGFYWLVTRDGRVKPDAHGQVIKQAYGNAFGIYALAAYYDMCRDGEALRLAEDAFHWLDRHAHDPAQLGYFNYMARDGTPLREGYGRDGPKDQNSSIHLLEAFTELYHVWPDATLRERLREMLYLIRDRIRVDPGTLTLFSTADWRPISYRDSSAAAREADRYAHDHVSFGHDVETAYLLLEAAAALGLEHDSTTLRLAKQMVDHALRNGWDDAVGGFYDAGYYFPDQPRLTLVQDTKTWWAQAEGLNTLLIMADRFPTDPLNYADKFLRQWSYIQTYLVDHEHGGWYQGGLDQEPGRRGDLKGHVWKATYHETRALMNVARRLDSLSARSAP